MTNEELIRESRVARATGTTVELIDAAHPDCKEYDAEEGGRWVTECADHGGFVQHTTWKTARKFLGHPEEWCPTCQESEPKADTSDGFSEEERARALETRRKKAEERRAAKDAEAAAKEKAEEVQDEWSAWTVGQPLVDRLYTPDEEKARVAAVETISESGRKAAAARRGRDQAEENLRKLPKVKSKKEKKNRERLEEESTSLDAIVVEEKAHAEDASAERDRLARIAYLRGCLAAGWRMRDGRLTAADQKLKIPADYLTAADFAKARKS